MTIENQIVTKDTKAIPLTPAQQKVMTFMMEDIYSFHECLKLIHFQSLYLVHEEDIPDDHNLYPQRHIQEFIELVSMVEHDTIINNLTKNCPHPTR